MGAFMGTAIVGISHTGSPTTSTATALDYALPRHYCYRSPNHEQASWSSARRKAEADAAVPPFRQPPCRHSQPPSCLVPAATTTAARGTTTSSIKVKDSTAGRRQHHQPPDIFQLVGWCEAATEAQLHNLGSPVCLPRCAVALLALDLAAGTDYQVAGRHGQSVGSAHASNRTVLPAIDDDLDLAVVLL